jgi:hypothetical protein
MKNEIAKIIFYRLSLEIWYKDMILLLVEYRKEEARNRVIASPTKREDGLSIRSEGLR